MRLVKKLDFERICCTCGVAEIPVDPAPEVTDMLRRMAKECGLELLVLDSSSEIVQKYKIKDLPAVIFKGKVYPADEKTLRPVLCPGSKSGTDC